MPLEYQITQAVHAAIEAGKRFQHADNVHVVTIGVPDEATLLAEAHRLGKREIPFALYDEPDFGPLGKTALVTSPIKGSQRKALAHHDLWRAS